MSLKYAIIGTGAIGGYYGAMFAYGGKDVHFLFHFGFSDSYTFVEGRGIQTPDFGEGLSRINYTLKRLEDLNKVFRVPEVCYKFSEMVKFQTEAISSLRKVLTPFHIDIFQDVSESVIKSVKVETKNSAAKPITESHSVPVYIVDAHTKDESAEKNKSEDTILGKISEGRKVVFISYSWDSNTHKDWVRKLADDLTAKGIYVLYDGYIEDGTPIDLFMELGIQRADKVIVIGTPDYMKKYSSTTTGTAFEGCIIRAYVVKSIGTKKIIPCLRIGDFKLSFPMILSSRKGHDFSDDDHYEEELDDLCREIWECPKRVRPTLGAIPNYIQKIND
jgi:hypothetical protein